MFFSTIAGVVYFVYHPNNASSIGRFVGTYIGKKVQNVSHSIYLHKLQDPDRDKDGLTDLAEKEIYKTDPVKSDSHQKGIVDGEYIYNVYQKAFDGDNEKLIAPYQKNLGLYTQFSSSTSKLFGNLSLNDAFNLRAVETYDFYVGVPADVIEIVKNALDARLSGDYQKSLELIEMALVKNPDSSILKYHLGLTYHRLKEYDKAIAIYKSIENDPAVKSPLLYSDLASVGHALGNDDDSIHYLETSIKEFPEDLTQYLTLSSYYQDKNQLDKAEGVLHAGLKIEPRYASYYNALAIISGLKGDNQKEFDLYKKAVSYDFRYAPGHLNLAILYYQYFDKSKEGLAEARIAFELDSIPRHLAQVILIYNDVGNKTKAHELELQLLKMKNIDAGSFNDIGLMYLHDELYTKAEFYFKKAIETDPKLSNAYNNLGNVLSHTNRAEEAAVNYKKAIEINPNYANAYNNLGIYYTDKKEYKTAIQTLLKAIELNPKLYRPYRNIGNIYFDTGDMINAKIYYQKAFDLGDKDSNVLKTLRR